MRRMARGELRRQQARPGMRDRRRSAGCRRRRRRSAFEEQASEQRGRAGAPAGRSRVGRRPSARHRARGRRPARAVDVRMMRQGRAPGMEDGDDADPGAEMRRIGGDRGSCLGGGLEQDVVERRPCSERRSSAIGAGSVKTTWKYGTGSRSASRAASHAARAAAPGTSGNAGCGS